MTTFTVAAVSWASGRLDVFGLPSNNAMYHIYYHGAGEEFLPGGGGGLRTVIIEEGPGFSGWQNLGAPVFQGSPAAVSWGSGRLDVFATTFNDVFDTSSASAIYHNWYDDSIADGFQGWENIGGPSPNSSPSVVSWGPNRLDVFVVGSDDAMWHIWFDGNASGWGTWERPGGLPDSLPNGFNSPPTAVSWGPNRLDVFAVGSDNALWHISFDGNASGWASWESLGGALSGRDDFYSNSAPSAVSWAPGRLDVFAIGSDKKLYHWWLSGSAWSNESLEGSLLSAGPSAVSSGPNQLDVFTFGPDSAGSQVLWHISFDGNTSAGWSSWEILDGATTYFAPSPPSAVSWAPDRLDVFAAGGAGEVFHYWSQSGSAWSAESLGAIPFSS